MPKGGKVDTTIPFSRWRDAVGELTAQGPERALIVDRHPAVRLLVASALADAGLAAIETGSAAVAEQFAPLVDAIVLDPDLDARPAAGVVERLRRRCQRGTILVLSSDRALEGRVAALGAGADDYLLKPAVPAEIVARIRIRRRVAGIRRLEDDVVLDLDRREVRRRGEPVALTRREFDLLAHLAANEDRVCSAEELLVTVWSSSSAYQQPATVPEHVYRLRRKVPGLPITTVRGCGYRFDGAVSA